MKVVGLTKYIIAEPDRTRGWRVWANLTDINSNGMATSIGGHIVTMKAESRDAAIAAAQADYESRILSALPTKPEAVSAHSEAEAFVTQEAMDELNAILGRTPTPTARQIEGDARLHEAAQEAVRNICEWDDRTSPDGYEDYILITPAELEIELFNFAIQATQSPTSGSGEPEVVAWRYCSHDINGEPWPWVYQEQEPHPDHAQRQPLVTLDAAQKALAARDAIYQSAVKGRSDFRQAYRDAKSRAETAEARLAQCMEALEPFALISTEGVVKQRGGHARVVVAADYFHKAAEALAALPAKQGEHSDEA